MVSLLLDGTCQQEVAIPRPLGRGIGCTVRKYPSSIVTTIPNRSVSMSQSNCNDPRAAGPPDRVVTDLILVMEKSESVVGAGDT